MQDSIEYLVVDLFAGAGGVTTGFIMAENESGQKLSKVIACVNHDPMAIKSHWINHPEVLHFEEDIRTLDLTDLISHVSLQRKLHANAKLILWASLECTNFSKAKGGQPRDADSRTLADHLHRYVTAINPEYVMIENVVEFMAWGPLDEKGKPISRKNGCEWVRWRNEMCAHGYVDQWKELNAADFGALTSRNRLFGIFAKPGMPISWPEPTHAKNPMVSPMYASLKKWRPVREVLELDDEGESIFNRKKPLVDNTLERIYAGMIKYVAGMGQKAFLSKYYSGNPDGKNISIDGPSGALKTVDSHAIVQMNFLMHYNSKDARTGEMRSASSIDEPARTVTTQRTPNIVFLTNYYGSGDNCRSIDEPSSTVIGADVHAIAFLDKQYGGKNNHQSLDAPAGTVMGNDKHALVKVKWIDRQFSSGGRDGSIDMPAGSILSVPKMSMVTAEPFIMDTQFKNVGSDINQPLGVITANRKHHYLINPGWIKGHTSSIDNPCPVIIARQDKTPLYVVALEQLDTVAIPVYEDDSEVMIRIKEFMVMYGISDIKMRMLKVMELKLIQGFPKDYVLCGNQSQQKKFIGNAVHCLVPKKWIESIHQKNRLMRVA